MEVRGREGGVGDLPVQRRPLGALARRLGRAGPLAAAAGRRAREGSERHEGDEEEEVAAADCGEHLARRAVEMECTREVFGIGRGEEDDEGPSLVRE